MRFEFIVNYFSERRGIFLSLKEFSSLKLSNGKVIKASLVVASDGRFSKTRSMVGISAYTHDFNKNMIVCRMKHEKSHKNIAYDEGATKGGLYFLLDKIIQNTSKVAIKVSEKI